MAEPFLPLNRDNQRRLLYCDGHSIRHCLNHDHPLWGQMRQPHDDDTPPQDDQSNDWGVAVAIALSIVICLAAFVWIFVELDPFLDDFTGTDATVTADPAASPVDESTDIDPGD